MDLCDPCDQWAMNALLDMAAQLVEDANEPAGMGSRVLSEGRCEATPVSLIPWLSTSEVL